MNVAERNPVFAFFVFIVLLLVVSLCVKLIIMPFVVASEAIDVAHEEFGPRAAKDKYEWFKNASATLDGYRADIQIAEGRVRSIEKTLNGDRINIERLSIAESELNGIKMSYNSLAAQYNSAMSKVNYRFASDFPRDYREYISK